MAKKAKGRLGGPRIGAGRPSFLDRPVKKLFVLEARHIELLDRLKTRQRHSGQSETLRWLLDTYDF